MVSSKFSRRPRIQQPPPVCKSKKLIITPPPGMDNELWLEGHWQGLCSDSVYRDLSFTIKFPEAFPRWDGAYYTVQFFDDIEIIGAVHDTRWPSPYVTWQWTGALWYASGVKFIDVPQTPPVNIGPMPADTTVPADQTSNFHLYTSYGAP